MTQKSVDNLNKALFTLVRLFENSSASKLKVILTAIAHLKDFIQITHFLFYHYYNHINKLLKVYIVWRTK